MTLAEVTAFAQQYAIFFVPMFWLAITPHRWLFAIMLMVVAEFHRVLPKIMYDCGQIADCVFEPSLKNTLYAFLMMWTLIQIPMLILDLFGWNDGMRVRTVG